MSRFAIEIEGLAKTYAWIEQQYNDRKAGKPTVS